MALQQPNLLLGRQKPADVISTRTAVNPRNMTCKKIEVHEIIIVFIVGSASR